MPVSSSARCISACVVPAAPSYAMPRAMAALSGPHRRGVTRHVVRAIDRCGFIARLGVGVPLAVRAQANPSPAQQNPAAMGAMDSTDRPSAMAAHEAMSGPLDADPHMVLTP